jgi:hypothetical protein
MSETNKEGILTFEEIQKRIERQKKEIENANCLSAPVTSEIIAEKSNLISRIKSMLLGSEH